MSDDSLRVIAVAFFAADFNLSTWESHKFALNTVMLSYFTLTSDKLIESV